MKNNSSLISLLVKPMGLLLTCLVLAACDGGISGTGDGGPVVVVPGVDADGAGVTNAESPGTDAAPDASADNGATETGDDGMSNTALPVIPSLPGSLLQAGSSSATRRLAQNILTITNDVQQLQSGIFSQATLQPMPIDDVHFDNALNYSQSNTQYIIEWSIDGALRYVFSTNTERTLYVLQDNQNLTMRRFDHAENRLFQASILGSESALVIEATINSNGDQQYFRSNSNQSNTVTFSNHPTDTTAVSQREILDQSGNITDLQTCTRSTAANDCLIDADWSATSSSTALSNTFAQTLTIVTNALTQIESPVNSLPQSINTAVIASTDNELDIDSNVQCGLQRVDNTIRSFCVRPLPLAPEGIVFQELISAGEVFYQRLP